MKDYILDLHLHSKYSRATSKFSDLETLEQWGKIKGIDILGTGDFTHPAWYRELESKLEPNGKGLFTLKEKSREYPEFLNVKKWGQHDRPFYFMLTTEISCIYKRHGKARRVHVCLWVPTIEAVQKIITKLDAIGNLKHDGRPILGLDVEELTKIVLDADERSLVVPAHIWTPWFAMFGSKSGFDSLEECFGDMTPYIYAAETGLSSDPPMNWRVKDLDHLLLVSNSDAHSPQNIGREANVVSLNEPSYFEFYEIIKNRDLRKFKYRIEFFPEEGKYHMDGHAVCQFVCEPEETVRQKGLCPDCGKKLTVGVMHRVHDLATREKTEIDETQFCSI